MKQNSAKQYAGLWLDNSKAILIANTTENAEYSIQDKVKAEGKQGGGSEHSMNNAKQSGNLKYFKDIAGLLSGYDEILVFGPGKAQEQFQNFLKDDNQFQNKKISIDSDEQLSDGQMIAKVRDFFKGHQA